MRTMKWELQRIQRVNLMQHMDNLDDWQQQVDTMQRKNASMRGFAKVWGMEEGRNPFADNQLPKKEEKKDKKETKTMTGKPMTKVVVDPEMKETKIGKKNVR